MNLGWVTTGIVLVMIWLALALRISHVLRTRRKIPVEPNEPMRAPSVRIVIAARNESRTLESALQSVLGQDYPNMEVVVVNDGSTDDTVTILSKISEIEPKLIVRSIQDPPQGWLGKNYALHIGAEDADTDWILFTDADVYFQPTAVRRALCFADSEGLDHLALFPSLRCPHPLMGSVFLEFGLLFYLFFRPHRARNPKSRAYVGSGSFNLVRTPWYRRVGGHVPIRMRPDDDVRLGKRLKEAGARQDYGDGRPLLEVEWYPNLRAMARGLEKNVYAALEYSFLRTGLAIILRALIFYWPCWIPLGRIPGRGWPYFILIGALMTWVRIDTARKGFNFPLSFALLFPVGQVILDGMLLRSIFLTWIRGGILWRERFYPLSSLRNPRNIL